MFHDRSGNDAPSDACPGPGARRGGPAGPWHTRRERTDDEAFVDAHLDSVYAVACLIIGEREQAASATVEAFEDVSRAPVRVCRGMARCRLMRALYRQCLRHTALATADGSPHAPAGGHSRACAGLQGLSLQQRSVIGLRIHGELACHDIADVLSLSVQEVIELMRVGLLELKVE